MSDFQSAFPVAGEMPEVTAAKHATLHAVQNGLPVPPDTSVEVLMVVCIVAALALFFAPTILAARGRRLSVAMVNVFLGWTLVGWGFALFMSVRSQEQAALRRGEWG